MDISFIIFMKSKVKNFLYKYRWWILIAIAFLAIRIFIFETFWQASLARGGWENFYSAAQAARTTLLGIFHEYCDWHPPLYYTLASVLLRLFHSQWAVYVAQFFLSFLALIFAKKALGLFFSEKIALIAVFLTAVEPYWAWHNILLTSENLSVPLFFISFYFLLRFLKFGSVKNLYWSAVFLGLTTLTRPNSLLLTFALTIILISLFLLKTKLKIIFLPDFTLKKLIKALAIFNLIFFAVLFPWMARNKIIYGRFNISNIVYTNIYFYNIPPLLAMTQGISNVQAYRAVKDAADKNLGANVGDQGDCQKFSKAALDRQFDFYQSESKKIITANFLVYAKMHLVRSLPFFIQPGYLDMWFSYGGDSQKPDITNAILRGEFGSIASFFGEMDLRLAIYFLGVIFWGICSLAVLASLLYSFFKDKDKFLFFLISAAILVYSALLTSPFSNTRYRLPFYAIFFVALVYIFSKLFSKFKTSRLKKIKKV